MKSRSGITVFALLIAMLGKTAFGQLGAASGPGSVTGTGTEELQRLPEIMRMRIVITSKGKDITEALAGLKDRVTAAKTQLAPLGADRATMTTDEPQLVAENS